MTTDQIPAPRVRAEGPGGFEVATSSGKRTPWWRLTGTNGEVLGHSEVYASLANAARGADAAERTVIVKAHQTGPVLWEVLRELDVLTAIDTDPDRPNVRAAHHFLDDDELAAVLELVSAGAPTPAELRAALVNLIAMLVVCVDTMDEATDADGAVGFEGGDR